MEAYPLGGRLLGKAPSPTKDPEAITQALLLSGDDELEVSPFAKL